MSLNDLPSKEAMVMLDDTIPHQIFDGPHTLMEIREHHIVQKTGITDRKWALARYVWVMAYGNGVHTSGVHPETFAFYLCEIDKENSLAYMTDEGLTRAIKLIPSNKINIFFYEEP